MSTRQQPQTEPEPQPDHTATRTRTRATPVDSATVRPEPHPATDRAPQTFSRRNTAQLENLIDEFNTAFARADGS